MNAYTLLLERHPLVFFHLVTAFGALLWKHTLGVMA